MCTAVTFHTECFYFGRNLDLERSYGECVTVTPRNYPFRFLCGTELPEHYALIGMATVRDGYPLYYEATNEKGLSLCGLNFPDNAVYHPWDDKRHNIAPFELIPWLLGQCATVEEALAKLRSVNTWNRAFSSDLSLSPLHWLLADDKNCVTLEPLADGLQITENPIGVLTNNPPFDYHMHNLTNYMNLTVKPAVNRFSRGLALRPYSLGMGSIGLPGDPSSASRFIRAAYTKWNSVCDGTEAASINQFFHILRSVSQPMGLTDLGNGDYEFTRYSSCCNTKRGVYYYTTYDSSRIRAVDMHRVDLNDNSLKTYTLQVEADIQYQN